MYHVFDFGFQAGRGETNVYFNGSPCDVCKAFLRILFEIFFYTRLSNALHIPKPYHLLHRRERKHLPFLPPHSRKLENRSIRVCKQPSVFCFVSGYAAANVQKSIKKSGCARVADSKSVFDGKG